MLTTSELLLAADVVGESGCRRVLCYSVLLETPRDDMVEIVKVVKQCPGDQRRAKVDHALVVRRQQGVPRASRR